MLTIEVVLALDNAEMMAVSEFLGSFFQSRYDIEIRDGRVLDRCVLFCGPLKADRTGRDHEIPAKNFFLHSAGSTDPDDYFGAVALQCRTESGKFDVQSWTDVCENVRGVMNDYDDGEKKILVTGFGFSDSGSEKTDAKQADILKQALEAIVSNAESSEDQARAIAAASEEQSAASEEINRTIQQIDTVSAQISRTMDEAAQATSSLAEQAQKLDALVVKMKSA